MPNGKQFPNKLSLEDIMKIIKLRIEEKASYHRIQKVTGHHWQTARNYIKQFEAIEV